MWTAQRLQGMQVNCFSVQRMCRRQALQPHPGMPLCKPALQWSLSGQNSAPQCTAAPRRTPRALDEMANSKAEAEVASMQLFRARPYLRGGESSRDGSLSPDDDTRPFGARRRASESGARRKKALAPVRTGGGFLMYAPGTADRYEEQYRQLYGEASQPATWSGGSGPTSRARTRGNATPGAPSQRPSSARPSGSGASAAQGGVGAAAVQGVSSGTSTRPSGSGASAGRASGNGVAARQSGSGVDGGGGGGGGAAMGGGAGGGHMLSQQQQQAMPRSDSGRRGEAVRVAEQVRVLSAGEGEGEVARRAAERQSSRSAVANEPGAEA